MQRETLISQFFESVSAIKRSMFATHAQGDAKKNLPSHAQLGVLFAVSHAAHMNIKDVASNFCMTSSGATQLVNALVKDGFLARKADKEDRRKITVSLTRKGKALLERAKKERRASLTKLLKPLTDTELAQLCAIQEKILAPLRNL